MDPSLYAQENFEQNYIERRIFILSSTRGWVLKRPANQLPDIFPLKGLAIYKCAVALFATSSGSLSLPIFSRAAANPSGYLVKRAPEASAKNSRFRDTASWIRVAIIGERIARIMPISKKIPAVLFPSRLFLLSPPYQRLRIKKSAKSATNPTNTTTIAISLISKFLM